MFPVFFPIPQDVFEYKQTMLRGATNLGPFARDQSQRPTRDRTVRPGLRCLFGVEDRVRTFGRHTQLHQRCRGADAVLGSSAFDFILKPSDGISGCRNAGLHIYLTRMPGRRTCISSTMGRPRRSEPLRRLWMIDHKPIGGGFPYSKIHTGPHVLTTLHFSH